MHAKIFHYRIQKMFVELGCFLSRPAWPLGHVLATAGWSKSRAKLNDSIYLNGCK